MANVTANQLIGKPVYDKGLHKVGKLSHLYIDGASHQPTWASVRTGFFGNKESFVPLSLVELSEGDQEVIIRTDKDVITDAPNVEPDGELTPREQAELYQHYRQALEDEKPSDEAQDQPEAEDQERDRSEAAGRERDDTSREEASQVAGSNGQSETAQDDGAAVTRYEEEMRVNKHTREAGKVHLKKYVVTENATVTIPLVREKVRIVREPVTEENWGDAGSGPAMTDQDEEVVLHEEIPTVQKITVPKERVRLGKTRDTSEEPVKGEVRKERVDIEGNDKENVSAET